MQTWQKGKSVIESYIVYHDIIVHSTDLLWLMNN